MASIFLKLAHGVDQLTIRNAQFSGDVAVITALIREYIATIERNACREEVESGLAGLQAPYDGPGNAYFLAQSGELIAGGVAFLRLETGEAEMARLFVRPEIRRHGVGRALVQRAVKEAAALGYRRVVLHTLPEWYDARALYGDLDFEPIATYAGVAAPEAACYARDLDVNGCRL